METFKAKKSDARNNARLSDGKLYIKGKLQTEFLEPSLPDPDPDDTEELEVSDSSQVKDSGSTFKSYAASPTTLAEVKAGINQILTLPDMDGHLLMSLAVLCLCVSVGMAKDCYQCEDCEDVDDYTDQKTNGCSSCTRTAYNGKVDRGCSVTNLHSGCTSKTYKTYDAEVCVCQADSCNGAPVAVSAKTLIVVMTVILGKMASW